MELKETIKRVQALAAIPLQSDLDLKRVEIIMLKFKEAPEVINTAVTRIIHNTDWPFKLTLFDNRANSANTSKIWNKLISESTCNYVLIIDSDAFLPKEKLSPCWLTRMMESIGETGIVIPVSSTGGGAHQHVSGPERYPSFVINRDIWSGYCFLIDKWRLVSTDSWVSEKKIELSQGNKLFDERFYIYGQDSEFAHRASKVGGAVMRKDVYVEHMGGHSFQYDPDRDADKLYARELFKYLTKKQ